MKKKIEEKAFNVDKVLHFLVFYLFLFGMIVVSLILPNLTIIMSLQITQAQINKNDHLDNTTSNLDTRTQAIVNQLHVMEESSQRHAILSIVSFLIGLAMAIFGIQLAFRPQKSDVKYFTSVILSLIIPVAVLLVSFVVVDISGLPGLGIIANNVWIFSALILLIPIVTLITLLILHRRAHGK